MTPDFESAEDLPALYMMLDTIKVKNGWNKPTPSLYPAPKQCFVPAHWDFQASRAALHTAGRLVSTEWAERRNLILANPVPGNDYPTVSTLVAAAQMVRGGEKAPSHRHTPNAMRVVIEAPAELYTVVDGVHVPMEPGDVLLTPNWCWHGHDNRSTSEAYWIDVLDAPLVQLLGPMFFEHQAAREQPDQVIDHGSAMRFPYLKYKREVLRAPEVSPGVRLYELGEGLVATFDRHAVRLERGAQWSFGMTTANQLFIVVDGEGRSRIGDTHMTWRTGDVLAAPSWITQHHTATSDAILIRVSDAPVMAALGWLRTLQGEVNE